MDNKKDTEYRLTTEEAVHFHIPENKNKRLNYADAIVTLLRGKNIEITNSDLSLPLVNSTIYSMISYIGVGILRDTILGTKIYDYFKLSKGSLLSILLEISTYKQFIDIDIQSGGTINKISNTIIKNVTINIDNTIELTITNATITLSSINDISNIFLISSNFPKTKTNLPNITIKEFFESYKNHTKYGTIQENYTNMIREFYSDEDIKKDLGLDKIVENLLKEKVDGMTLVQRARRRIKVK